MANAKSKLLLAATAAGCDNNRNQAREEILIHLDTDARRVLGKLNTELNKILSEPDVKQKFADQGGEPIGGPPGRFGEHLRT